MIGVRQHHFRYMIINFQLEIELLLVGNRGHQMDTALQHMLCRHWRNIAFSRPASTFEMSRISFSSRIMALPESKIICA
ncbi:hypothetical protein C8024_02700 [Sphingopyxis sp. BSNA05]|nr:hypothetical protein [Sphingopyxis sp. BSNA05]